MDSDDDFIIVDDEYSLFRHHKQEQIKQPKQISLFSILSSIDNSTHYKNMNWPIKEANLAGQSVDILGSYCAA